MSLQIPAHAPKPGRFGPRLLAVVFHVALCLAALAAIFQVPLFSGFHRFIINDGDGLLNNYFLEHSYQFVTHRAYRGGLWSPQFYYPAPNVLTYSDNLFGAAPIYWLFRTVVGPHLAFELWMAAVLALSYAAFAYLLRRQHIGHLLCGVGAFLFAFGMPRVWQLGHQQLLPQFFTPLAMLFLIETLRAPTLGRMNLTALFIFWQLLAGIYLGWFLVFASVVFVALALSTDWSRARRLADFVRTRFIAVAASLAGWGALLLLFMRPYLRTMHNLGGWDFHDVDPMLPRLGSWFLPFPDVFWYRYLGRFSQDLPMLGEHMMFNGFMMLLMGLAAGVIVWRAKRISASRRWLVKSSLLTFLAIFLLSLRFGGGFTAWRWVFAFFPGAHSIRAVARIWTIADAFLLLGGVLGIDAWCRTFRAGSLPRLAVPIGVAALALLEQPWTGAGANVHFDDFVRDADSEAALIRGADAAYLVINRSRLDDNSFGVAYSQHQDIASMWAGIRANVPVINGSSGLSPPGLRNLGGADNPISIDKLTAWLGDRWRGNLCIVVEQHDADGRQLLADQIPAGPPVARNPRFLARTLALPARLRTYPILLNTPINACDPDFDAHHLVGWSSAAPTDSWRWSNAPSVQFRFALDHIQPLTLRLMMLPFICKGLPSQRVLVSLNGHDLESWTLSDGQFHLYEIPLPEAFLAADNRVTLSLPDHRSPKEMGLSTDARDIAVGLKWLSLNSGPGAPAAK